MTTIDSPKEKFNSAVQLLGESWLNEQLEKRQTESSAESYDYQVPIPHDDLPPVVKAYRRARDDLNDDQPEGIELPEWRNESIDFLKLGKIYETIEKAPVIDPSGNRLENLTVPDLFRDRLRSEREYESSKYELEVAAAYDELGHTPALIKEDESNAKTPDIELIDLSPSVQVECKYCRQQSEEETKQSNRANQLFENIQTQLPHQSHVVLLELTRNPTKQEVENIHNHFVSTKVIENKQKIDVTLPFGKLSIVSLPFDSPILYPSYDMVGVELMKNFYEDIIKPAVSKYFSLNKEFDDYGNHVLLFEAQDRKSTKIIRRANFIAINESTWGNDVYNRFQNQFKNVSDKFNHQPSVLHIDFPNINEGDSIQELEIRKHAGGQLVLRPDISAVVVSGSIYHPKMSEDIATRRTIKIPNYDPKYKLPKKYELIDHEAAKSADELRKNANEDLLKDPEGAEKAINKKEGTLSFRFKPNESRPIENEKFIADIVSKDENKRLKLLVTPDETIQLQRLEIETGCWICDIDISDLPELDPIHIFITWSSEEVGLSVGHQSDDDLRDDRCECPVDKVTKKDGIPQIK